MLAMLCQNCIKRMLIFLAAAQAFPYVKKRIQVVYVQQQELNPIQVAIDELKAKVNEMKEVLMVDKPDMKRLQLLLQGSVSVTVSESNILTHV